MSSLDTLAELVGNLRLKVESLQDRVDELESENEVLEDRVDELESENQALADHVCDLETENAVLQSRADSLNGGLDDHDEAIAELQARELEKGAHLQWSAVSRRLDSLPLDGASLERFESDRGRVGPASWRDGHALQQQTVYTEGGSPVHAAAGSPPGRCAVLCNIETPRRTRGTGLARAGRSQYLGPVVEGIRAGSRTRRCE